MKKLIIGIVIGASLTASTTILANTIKEYRLVEATYPIEVNTLEYNNAGLPVLNYEGNTYVPLQAISENLNTTVRWNQEKFAVEIRDVYENQAFRIHEITGSNGNYTITGEARVWEASFVYAVSDGHDYLLEDFTTASNGAPSWGNFTIDLAIPQDRLPVNGTLTLEIWEASAKDGSPLHLLNIPLESFR
ncbi:Gmad2 immunoglobulin-like domain-containing protein [Paenibacillus senegalensis]|uniref:Gmad2 immunoglobulin-like domain-containing protein n=1 Tax=Paenibacillus senegalensis TaxID=1465766 RepID=UPI000289752F|nr:Gmad2 immunoglobulin-like domain-containing protein [Paenibacillus senegalensis]